METENKKLVIGVDEAGYGPNLGPLLIGASVWQVPVMFSENEFIDAFAKGFADRAWFPGCEHVPLGDSKKLYKPGLGLQSLETGLFATAAEQFSDRRHLGELNGLVTGFPSLAEVDLMPWYRDLHRLTLPMADAQAPLSIPMEIRRLASLARRTLVEFGIELVGLKAAVLHESLFNQEIDRLGSKGQLLSQRTLQVVTELVSDSSMDCEVYCDRQGGRKNYMPILMDAMPDCWFQETLISAQRCSYRALVSNADGSSRNIDVHFSVGGDRYPATALASMFAKYLRERLMEAFNDFWQRHVPDLRPTAGYPQDAKRFRAAIDTKAQELGLDARHWWRSR